MSCRQQPLLRPETHLDTVTLMLRLEHDLLDCLDPLIPTRFTLGGESVITLRSPQFEAHLVDWVATRGILKGNIALGEIGVLRAVSEIIVSMRKRAHRCALEPA